MTDELERSRRRSGRSEVPRYKTRPVTFEALAATVVALVSTAAGTLGALAWLDSRMGDHARDAVDDRVVPLEHEVTMLERRVETLERSHELLADVAEEQDEDS